MNLRFPISSFGLSLSQLLQIWRPSFFWEICMRSYGHCLFSSRLLLRCYSMLFSSLRPHVLAINDKYTLIWFLIAEIANNLPLWHWWQHLHSDSTLLCIRPFRLWSVTEIFELDSLTPFSPFDINVKEETFFHWTCCRTYSPCHLYAFRKSCRYSISTPPDLVDLLNTRNYHPQFLTKISKRGCC